MRVGFIGLGRMGGPMATNLVKAGNQVVGYDPFLTAAAASRLQQNGVSLCRSLADLFASEVTFNMLPDDTSTLETIESEPGLLQSAAAGHIHVIMGTVSPKTVRFTAELAASSSITVIDSPVSGSVSLAASAEITTMTGGSPEVFAKVRPLLAAMTRAQVHVGPTGTGATMKLALNAVLAVYNQAVAEGLSLAQKNGVDVARAYDIFENSVISTPYLTYKRDHFIRPEETEVAMPLSLLLKDVRLASSIAEDLELSLIDAARQELETAAERGSGHHDMASVRQHR